jgi:hypothetical protein
MRVVQNEIKKMRGEDNDSQIIIREKELERYLKDGWEFVSVLLSKKILISK